MAQIPSWLARNITFSWILSHTFLRFSTTAYSPHIEDLIKEFWEGAPYALRNILCTLRSLWCPHLCWPCLSRADFLWAKGIDCPSATCSLSAPGEWLFLPIEHCLPPAFDPTAFISPKSTGGPFCPLWPLCEIGFSQQAPSSMASPHIELLYPTWRPQ
jgi:hypothetical protein